MSQKQEIGGSCNKDSDCVDQVVCLIFPSDGRIQNVFTPIPGAQDFSGVCYCDPSYGYFGNDCKIATVGSVLMITMLAIFAILPLLVVTILACKHLYNEYVFRKDGKWEWNSANIARVKLILALISATTAAVCILLGFHPIDNPIILSNGAKIRFGAEVLRVMMVIASVFIIATCLDIAIVWISVALSTLRLQVSNRSTFQSRTSRTIKTLQFICAVVSLGFVLTPLATISSAVIILYSVVIMCMCVWGGWKLRGVLEENSRNTTNSRGNNASSSIPTNSEESSRGDKLHEAAVNIRHAARSMALGIAGFLIPLFGFFILNITRHIKITYGSGSMLIGVNYTLFFVGFCFQAYLLHSILVYLRTTSVTMHRPASATPSTNSKVQVQEIPKIQNSPAKLKAVVASGDTGDQEQQQVVFTKPGSANIELSQT